MIEEIELKEGVKAELQDKKLVVTGPKGALERTFNYPGIKTDAQNNKVTIKTSSEKNKMKKIIKTWAAHVKNMIRGAEKGFEYRLKIASSHFPISASAKDNTVIIKNFMGEKKDRKARIMPGSQVKIQGTEIIVESADREKAGQTAANIEKATRVTNKDRRTFMDGIYIIQKPGREE